MRSGWTSESCSRALIQFVTTCLSTRRPSVLRFEPRCRPRSFARSAARLSSMLQIASQSSFTAGWSVLDVEDGEREQLHGGLIVREVPAVLDDLAELEVQRLDRVGRIDHPPQLRWEREERREPLPRVLEHLRRSRVRSSQL